MGFLGFLVVYGGGSRDPDLDGWVSMGSWGFRWFLSTQWQMRQKVLKKCLFQRIKFSLQCKR